MGRWDAAGAKDGLMLAAMATSPPQRALRTGRLLELGVTRGELGGPRWRAPYRGIHTPQVALPTDPRQRIHDAAELLPAGGAVGGWAAAHLLGATDLDGRGRTGRDREPVRLVIPPALHLTDRERVVYWRSALGPDDIREVNGIPVTAPLRTAFDLARSLPLEDAVVALDVMARQLGIAPGAVEEFLRSHRRFRGVPLGLRAARLAEPRSRSCGESRLRVVWMVDARLPQPQSNPIVVDGSGSFVAMPDLLDLDAGMVAEYDGSGHRDLGVHTHDNAREENMERVGLVVVRATSLDVGPLRRVTVRRLIDGRRRALALDPAARTWGWRPSPLPPMIDW
jgi:hypothetical protein